MTPADKYKKIDKEYILSDSSVNEYGFRLLTSGYQLDAFQKNPIGYYMHRRDDGVVLKWDDLRVADDKITGTPVINLSNERGQQTCDEAENGFLNAASVGHIVVLEYSTDPEMMLPGQTGPTITKWYNKECSLVDIPGNCHALTQLYDAQENEINLVDIGIQPLAKRTPVVLSAELLDVLNLSGSTDDNAVLASVKELVLKAKRVSELETANKKLYADKAALQQQLNDLHTTQTRYEVTTMLDEALEHKKVTVALKERLAADYAENPEGLKALLGTMPAYRSIVETLKAVSSQKTELQWSWDEYEANDPSGKKLKTLKADHPERYREIFKEKFGS